MRCPRSPSSSCHSLFYGCIFLKISLVIFLFLCRKNVSDVVPSAVITSSNIKYHPSLRRRALDPTMKKYIARNTVILILVMLCCSLLYNLWPHNRAALQSVFYKEVVRTKYIYTRPPPWSSGLPVIFAITPTYSRPVQKAELTRLANTFLHVPNLHWIVVEDSKNTSTMVSHLLQSTGLNYTHLHVETPLKFKVTGGRKRNPPRGTLQRNLALQWLRQTFSVNDSHPGVVYFADDDNTYSLQLFEEMRFTTKVSVWPVAFVGGLPYESPKVNSSGKVYGWRVIFDPHRPFAIDMAGFAVNLKLILTKPQATFKLTGVKAGYQESSLLTDLVSLSDLEPKASNCTKVLVWHTRTQTPILRKNITGLADLIGEI